jgi:hypothetical protein
MTRARDLADTQDNLGGAVPPFAAGKNKVINGDFGIWQRGSGPFTTSGGYSADRFLQVNNGSGAVYSVTQQTFTPGTAPVSGYESAYFLRYDQTTAGTGATVSIPVAQRIEDVRTLAGQTVTLSFWAKTNAASSFTLTINQAFGTGGSATVAYTSGSYTTSTSWQRFTLTVALNSISGKTIGTNSSLSFSVNAPVNVVQTWDIWGVQLEAGSVATPFQTATGTIQGELAACQRYYMLGTMDVRIFSGAVATKDTAIPQKITPMRITPTPAFTAAASASENISGTPSVTMTDAVTLRQAFVYSAINTDTYYVRAYELAAEL